MQAAREFFDVGRPINAFPFEAPHAYYIEPARELDDLELIGFRAAAGIRGHVGTKPHVPIYNVGLDPANAITTPIGEVTIGAETAYITYRRPKSKGR